MLYHCRASEMFFTGDARPGRSSVDRAISERREAARCVDIYLSGQSELPAKGQGDLPRIG